jgi:septum site-determining protein MinD
MTTDNTDNKPPANPKSDADAKPDVAPAKAAAPATTPEPASKDERKTDTAKDAMAKAEATKTEEAVAEKDKVKEEAKAQPAKSDEDKPGKKTEAKPAAAKIEVVPARKKEGTRVLTITSGKGGVGKTTATANLGVALAKLGKRVVCIDADIGLRNLDVVMGLENRIVYDLVDVVEGRSRLRQAMIKDKRLPEELYLIPAAQTRDKTAISPSDMVRICNELSDVADYILIDSPAGIERGFRNAVAPADEVIIVTNPEVAAVRDADRIIGLIEAEQKGPGQLILNRMKPEMIKRGDMLTAEDVIDILAVKLLGVIPEDESVIISTNRGTPVSLDEKSKAGQAFKNIARRLEGHKVPFMPLEDDSGFLQKLSRLMRATEKE